MAVADPALLDRLRRGLADLYGERIERAVLFGSQARGDAGENSDYDVAVFLKDFSFENRLAEMKRLDAIKTDILLETGDMVSILLYPERFYTRPTPLMHEIRREGRDL
jgi:predicted nucleotidyltransferase